jgi:hypothetical protein
MPALQEERRVGVSEVEAMVRVEKMEQQEGVGGVWRPTYISNSLKVSICRAQGEERKHDQRRGFWERRTLKPSLGARALDGRRIGGGNSPWCLRAPSVINGLTGA